MSGPISWNSDSSRLTSTTCPTPECTPTIVANAATSAGDLVGQRDRREQRAAVGLAVDRREPAHRLGDGGEARTWRVRAVLAETGDPRDHEPRVAGEEHVGAEPEPLEGAGTEVLDQHVGLVAEPAHHVEVGGVP